MLKKYFNSSSCGWLIIVMLSCGCSCEPEDAVNNNYHVKAKGVGMQSSVTVVNGKTSFEGSFNPQTNLLLYHVSWEQLNSPVKATCISIADHAGSELNHEYFNLEAFQGASGSWHSRMILTSIQAEALINGRLFFSIYAGSDTTMAFSGRMEAIR